jgi:hypothetical protein
LNTREIQLGCSRIAIETHSLISEEKMRQLDASLQGFVLPKSRETLYRLVVAIGLSDQEKKKLLRQIQHDSIRHQSINYWLYAPKQPEHNDTYRILNCVEAMAVSSCMSKNAGLLLHAASVCANGQGFIALGKSGAGKSTFAMNSVKAGVPVLGDDRVFVLKNNNQGFNINSTPKIPPQIVTHSDLHPPLNGIFVLIQADADRLVPISQTQIAKKLFESFREQPASWVLSLAMQKSVYNMACIIARQVPGYYLYLRNSPDFWNVVNAELFK